VHTIRTIPGSGSQKFLKLDDDGMLGLQLLIDSNLTLPGGGGGSILLEFLTSCYFLSF